MKKNILLACWLMTALLLQAQSKKILESKIDKVTIFIEGAQVERSSKTNLVAGKYELVFAGISPAIDKQSIQVKADGNLTVLSVIHQQNFLQEQQKQDEIKTIEASKNEQLDKITQQKNILNVFKEEEAMLIKNQQIGGANTGLKPADLKEAVDFQRSRLTEVYQKQMEISATIKKLEIELTKMDKQLNELHQKADQSTSEIHISTIVKEAGNINFVITYMVKKAGWFPTYDIRVKDIISPINLQYKANLFQQSGEDWKDVKLFLSTGNPTENGTKPTIEPWCLRYTYYTSPILIRGANSIQGTSQTGTVAGVIRNEKGEPIPFATITAKGTKTGTSADANGFFSLQIPPGNTPIVISSAGYESKEIVPTGTALNINMQPANSSLNEVVVVGYGMKSDGYEDNDYNYTEKSFKKRKDETAITTVTNYQPTTTIYEIQEPYTVLNDGKTYTADINGYEVNALYEYYAAPKLEPDAFLTAKITDWQELNLLPGEANLYFEGTFLGKSVLDIANTGDTLKLSLGKDKGVLVKRTLQKEFSSKKFLGNNKTDSRQYEILVRNNKSQPINIIVEDQFPISTQKEIDIQNRKYEGAKLDDETQKITWQFSLEPKKENKVNFHYEVKYPKDKQLLID
jgi:hypothetical protein